MKTPRFVIGIDLGTTTCSLTYWDLHAETPKPQALPIPQWHSEGYLKDSFILPSFTYLPPKALWKRGQWNLPKLGLGDESSPMPYAVGEVAHSKAVTERDQVIHSAKSWLSHRGVDRRARILPWHSETLQGDERLSPVGVSALYLEHLRRCWELTWGEMAGFCEQHIVITVPASFDELASRLTLEAAEKAGFPMDRVRLLEEPQAAFYNWLQNRVHGAHSPITFAQALAEELLPPGDFAPRSILVCDIGGGTTDFSLFALNPREETSDIQQTQNLGVCNFADTQISRIAVSEHILLGGDNLDSQIAHHLEGTSSAPLSRHQWGQLLFQAKGLKEKALEPDDPDVIHRIALHQQGGNLFQTTLTLDIPRREIAPLILERFFPLVSRDERPEKSPHGLKELGLPYAADAAITRHLAAFLAGRDIHGVLYTGGTLVPRILRRRITEQITLWQGFAPKELDNETSRILGVSSGAAIYGASLFQAQRPILARYPRNLYVSVHRPQGEEGNKTQYLCLLPKGHDFRQEISISLPGLQVMLGKPVSFSIFQSSVSDIHLHGHLYATSEIERLEPLALLQTTLTPQNPLPKGSSILNDAHPCRLQVQLSETELLLLTCSVPVGDTLEKWQLDFSASLGGKSPDTEVGKSESPLLPLPKAMEMISEIYGKTQGQAGKPLAPSHLMRELETLLGPKDSWTIPTLRELLPALLSGAGKRQRSEQHEITWLNLAGYLLRPGWGHSLDSFRIKELASILQGGLCFPKSSEGQTQLWILWRRIAGGLSTEQQDAVYGKIFPALRNQTATGEMYLLAGSLERIDGKKRIQLGNLLLDQLAQSKDPNGEKRLWALARLASRIPLYAGAEGILGPHIAEMWLQRMVETNLKLPLPLLIQFYSQIGRKVGLREVDLSSEASAQCVHQLQSLGASSELISSIYKVIPMSDLEKNRLFGEKLPEGFLFG